MSETNTAPTAESSSSGSRLVNNKTRLLLVGLVLALSLGYLLYTAFPGNARYYLKVSEFKESEQELIGTPVRVWGNLDSESYSRAEGTLDHTFALVEGGQRINAHYVGPLNDLFFNEHSEIVLEGTYQGDIFQVEADPIVKCPSKYQALTREQGGLTPQAQQSIQ